MESNTYSARIETVKNDDRVNALVEKLRKKLKGFILMDNQGQLVGDVRDLTLDNNRKINLIVSQPSNSTTPCLFLLMSRSIQKIEPSSKVIFVDISKAEIEHSHKYIVPGVQEPELPTILGATVQKTLDTDTIKDSNQHTFPDTSKSKAVMPAQSFEAAENQEKMNEDSMESLPTSEVLEEEIIRLLGERLIVDHSRHKIGEIVVRKEIETRMIQVPVRREKLIIEQVGPEHKQLAEIDLGQQEIADNNIAETASAGTKPNHLDDEFTVRGTFKSPKTVSLLLNAIALERQHGSKEVRVEILVEDASRQKIYQEWFDRCSRQQ